jgi:hypothetical protein
MDGVKAAQPVFPSRIEHCEDGDELMGSAKSDQVASAVLDERGERPVEGVHGTT